MMMMMMMMMMSKAKKRHPPAEPNHAASTHAGKLPEMDVVAECVNFIMPVAMVSGECFAIDECDIFSQLNDDCNVYNSPSASNVVARQNRYKRVGICGHHVDT